jgi:hypothetical protein
MRHLRLFDYHFGPDFDGSGTLLVQPHIRFNVREKRTDAKNALKNILLNGGPFQVLSPTHHFRQFVNFLVC